MAALFGRKIGVPHVDDENESEALAVVPDFVFEGVVENEEATLLPGARLVGDTDTRLGRHHQAEVAAKTAVSRTAMRPYARATLHDRKFDLQAAMYSYTLSYFLY